MSMSSKITSYGRLSELLSDSELITISSASYPLDAWSTSTATFSDLIICVTISSVNGSSFAIKNLSFRSLIWAILGISSNIFLLILLLSASLPLESTEYSDNISFFCLPRAGSLGMKLTKSSMSLFLGLRKSEWLMWLRSLLITSDYWKTLEFRWR